MLQNKHIMHIVAGLAVQQAKGLPGENMLTATQL